jgi:hypothetical protein
MILNDGKTIQVWCYDDAPEEYRYLGSPDDADWVVLVPKELAGDYIPWIDRIGSCDVESHTLPTGEVVYIGYHA